MVSHPITTAWYINHPCVVKPGVCGSSVNTCSGYRYLLLGCPEGPQTCARQTPAWPQTRRDVRKSSTHRPRSWRRWRRVEESKSDERCGEAYNAESPQEHRHWAVKRVRFSFCVRFPRSSRPSVSHESSTETFATGLTPKSHEWRPSYDNSKAPLRRRRSDPCSHTLRFRRSQSQQQPPSMPAISIHLQLRLLVLHLGQEDEAVHSRYLRYPSSRRHILTKWTKLLLVSCFPAGHPLACRP